MTAAAVPGGAALPGQIDRRALLRAGLQTAAVVAAYQAVASMPLSGFGPAVPVADDTPPSMAAFTALLGQTFVASSGGSRQEFVLAAVDPVRSTAGAPTVGEAFSLLFDGPVAAADDPGRIAWLHHRDVGAAPYFLAPVGGERRWEAVIDRRRPTRGGRP